MGGLIAVTGATGQLGGRVAQRLVAAGRRQRLIVRVGSRLPALPDAGVAEIDSYADPQLCSALEGVDTLYLVSAREAPDRVQQHRMAVDAAVAAYVKRIVYVSFVSAGADATFTWARDHHWTEEYIRASGLRFTFLRSSPYLDLLPFLPSDDGVIRAPAGDGRISPVSRDDIADTAVGILLGDGHAGHAYDITGSEALSLADAAALLATASGRPVRYLPQTIDEARASRAAPDVPAWQLEGWISSYMAIAMGELAVVTRTVREVTGHEPQSAAAWLAANPETLVR